LNFFLTELKQLTKISSCSLDTALSTLNLGFIFDEHIFLSDQISALSKSCYSHIGQLRYIRPYLDHKTARTVATSIEHCKLNYCISLLLQPKYRVAQKWHMVCLNFIKY